MWSVQCIIRLGNKGTVNKGNEKRMGAFGLCKINKNFCIKKVTHVEVQIVMEQSNLKIIQKRRLIAWTHFKT